MNHRTHLTILTLIGTLLGATVAAGAQTAAPATAPLSAPHGHRHGGMMARALAGLNITPQEKTQIKAAQAKYKASRTTATPETHAQLKSDIEAALTPDQRGQFQSNIKTMHAHMKADRAHDMAPVPTPT